MTSTNNGLGRAKNRRSLAVGQYAFTFCALFVCLIIVYGNSFHGTWHFDDFPNIVENQNVHLRSLTWTDIQKSFYGIRQDQKNIVRPLSYLSFALNHYFGGLGVFGYHLVNFGIHCLATAFLFLLIYNILELPVMKHRYRRTAYPIALFAAFFWATHPIQVSAVTYIVQRMASMAGMFYVMSMYFYIKFRTINGKPLRYGLLSLGVLFALFSIASKENAVMLPFSILLCEVLLLQGVPNTESKIYVRVIGILVPFLVVIGILFKLPSILNGYGIRPFTLQERLLTEPRIIVFYISLLLYPTSSRFALLHDIQPSTSLLVPWTTLPSVFAVIVMIIIAVRIRRRRPLVAFSILFFFLNHLIEGSVVPLELVYEHRNYIPSFFFFVPPAILGLDIYYYFSHRRPLQLLIVFVVTFLLAAQGHTTYLRNDIFSSDLALWSDNVKKAPNLHRPHHNLGKAYLAAGLYEQSLREMRMALNAREGARIGQKYTTYHNLGIYYLDRNEYDKAWPLFLKSLDLKPNNYKSFLALATIMLHRNSIPKAQKYVDIAVRLNPYYPQSYYIQGLIRLKQGDIDAAVNAGKQALQHNPNEHTPYFLLGEACRLKNNLLSSVDYFNKYLKQYPQQISANLALIELYYLLNQTEALQQRVSILLDFVSTAQLAETISAYHERDNYLDESRIVRIAEAIEQTVPLPSDGQDRLLKAIHQHHNNDRKK